ncbi:hypothetical protein F5884DRAFT_158982 [Xylogone sp. PMI_703]|nr:hypothetical protein F5884DRAFT_158982 [Xylogone sp. PMI_703]
MSARNSVEVSHGRGGAGNIRQDATPYGDGEIVREGAVGDHGDGAFSTGRGGAANIGSPGLKADHRKDNEVVPEVALRPSMDKENFHTGRGGEGNVHIAESKSSKSKHPEGLADKLKYKIFGRKKEPATV